MMRTDGIGLYIHIPFCVSKCNYCDFCSYPNLTADVREAYIRRLTEEIKSYKSKKKIKLDTVFFGGGTPSLLTPSEIYEIWGAVRDTFDTASICEFTFEANPKTVTHEICQAYKNIGANRISIGMQSVHENELKKLGRIHTHRDTWTSVRIARSYFSNLSLDLMYGIPGQTVESFKVTLGAALSLLPDHVSVYGLIVEEGTPFHQMRDSLALPDEDTECQMYEIAAKMLAADGYHHYEISNYAKDGYACRHNMKYWRAEEYIGVGVAAASYFGKYRYTNTRDIYEYLKPCGTSYNRVSEPSDERTEYIMLGLRTSEGISKEYIKARFGKELLDGLLSAAEKFKPLGYLSEYGDRIFLTERGFYLSNYIISELI